MAEERDERLEEKIREQDELMANLPEPPAEPTPDTGPSIPDTSPPIVSARDEEGLGASLTPSKPPETPSTPNPLKAPQEPPVATAKAPEPMTQDEPSRASVISSPDEPSLKVDFPAIDLSDAIPAEEIEPDVDTDIIRAIHDYGTAVNALFQEISMRVDELTVGLEELRSRYYRHP